MNVVKEIERLNEAELRSGTGKSWHDVYKDSAYIFIGNLDHRLTEGDIRTVFSQFGEPTDLNLVRDKETGKSKGFCFLAYEDQRSTVLAVDNFNGAKLMGRTLRVDHTKDYEPPEVRKLRQQERDRQRGKEVEEAAEDGLNPKELLLKQLRGEAPAPRRGILPDEPTDEKKLSKEEKKRLKKAKKEKKRAKKEKKRAKKERRDDAPAGGSASSSSDSENEAAASDSAGGRRAPSVQGRRDEPPRRDVAQRPSRERDDRRDERRRRPEGEMTTHPSSRHGGERDRDDDRRRDDYASRRYRRDDDAGDDRRRETRRGDRERSPARDARPREHNAEQQDRDYTAGHRRLDERAR